MLVQGRTRPELVKRHLELGPGDVFSMRRLQADLGRLSALGVFDDAGARPVPSAPAAAAAAAAPVATGGAGAAVAAAEGPAAEAAWGAGDSETIDLDFQVQEKKKFGQFSAQGGATMVRTCLASFLLRASACTCSIAGHRFAGLCLCVC